MFRQFALICLSILFCCTGTLCANCDHVFPFPDPCEVPACIEESKNGKAIEIDAMYTGGVFSNLRGGERTGTTYMGVAEIGITADTEKMRLWRNGTFFGSCSEIVGAISNLNYRSSATFIHKFGT